MNSFSCVCCSLVIFVFVNIAQASFWRNTQCSPPRGDICVEVRKCPYFDLILKATPIPRPKWVINILKKHHCGFKNEDPMVCCTIRIKKLDTQSFVHSSNVANHPNLRLLPRSTCGRTSNNFRIAAGRKAAVLEFPWMALLVYSTDSGLKFLCGATVINERYVLTAAHCIVNLQLVGVRLGEHNINTEKDCDDFTGVCAPPVQDFFVEDVTVHLDYKPGKGTTPPENDIALVRLATPANFSYANIQPICLPIGEAGKLNLNGKSLVVTGWGHTESGFRSEKLLKVSIPIVPNDDCKPFNLVNYKQICAGGDSRRRDSCSGDSGGPLQYVVQDNLVSRYVQYGIVSFGPTHCGTPGLSGLYTNTVYYVQWILDNLKPDS